MRSLLHEDQLAFIGKDLKLILWRQTDQVGRPYIFTSSSALKMLLSNDSHGYVYACPAPQTAEPFGARKDLEEWRVSEPVGWDWVASTTADDLHCELLVIDAPDKTAHEYLKQFTQSNASPLELSQNLEIGVYRFDEWRRSQA